MLRGEAARFSFQSTKSDKKTESRTVTPGSYVNRRHIIIIIIHRGGLARHVSHLCDAVVTFFFPSSTKVFTFSVSSFRNVYNTSSSFCFLCVTPPIDLPQSQTSWLWMLPSPSPWEARLLTPSLHLSPGLSAGREQGVRLVWRVGPQMDIDVSGMCYAMGFGSGLSGPATAVSHNSGRCRGVSRASYLCLGGREE